MDLEAPGIVKANDGAIIEEIVGRSRTSRSGRHKQMGRKGSLTKILALASTLLVGFPIVMPVLFAVERLIRARHSGSDRDRRGRGVIAA